jgi:tRNA threonylcarbamoyladenosine biosynthesis protein TsaB
MILSLETSSPICSVALHERSNGRLLGQAELRLEKSHSTHLTVLIEQLVANTGHTLRDLTAVAVSDGPGSYTGLRIGAAAAKGLCFALDIPLLAVGTLPALAHQVAARTPRAGSWLYCPMLDAQPLLLPTNLVLDADSLAEHLAHHSLLFFGSGAIKFQSLVSTNPQAVFLGDVQPSAISTGELALGAYQRQEFQDVAYYEPFYLKEVYTTTPKSTSK